MEGAPQYSPEEYEVYQSAVNAAPEEREDKIIQFVAENPRSELVQYAASSYAELMQDYQGQGQNEKALNAGKRMLELLPEDSNALYLTAVSAFQAQRFQEAVLYGEKAYSANSTPGLAYVLANSFRPLKDYEKYAEYGLIACQGLEDVQCHNVALDLMRQFASQKKLSRAAKYAQQAIDGLDPSDHQNRVDAYGVLGRNEFEDQDWSTSVANYQKVLSLSSDATAQAAAYYYIGMSQWKLKDFDSAMQAFAKGSIKKAPHSKHCRQQLEFMYKSTHNGSLAGLDDFLERSTR